MKIKHVIDKGNLDARVLEGRGVKCYFQNREACVDLFFDTPKDAEDWFIMMFPGSRGERVDV